LGKYASVADYYSNITLVATFCGIFIALTRGATWYTWSPDESFLIATLKYFSYGSTSAHNLCKEDGTIDVADIPHYATENQYRVPAKPSAGTPQVFCNFSTSIFVLLFVFFLCGWVTICDLGRSGPTGFNTPNQMAILKAASLVPFPQGNNIGEFTSSILLKDTDYKMKELGFSHSQLIINNFSPASNLYS
jgi:hypothetical protein